MIWRKKHHCTVFRRLRRWSWADSLWGNIRARKKKSVCRRVRLCGLTWPQWEQHSPLGKTFGAGAALDSCINFRVMMPLHQKKMRQTKRQHLELPEQYSDLFMFLSVSTQYSALQKHIIVCLNTFNLVLSFVYLFAASSGFHLLMFVNYD